MYTDYAMVMHPIRVLPMDDRTNGWTRIIPTQPPRPRLDKKIAADWLIIGAGYAGLAAARRLGELHPKAHIVMVEAGVTGENASGKNSGIIATTGLHDYDTVDTRLMFAGQDVLQTLVQQHQIQCNWGETGHYRVAVSGASARQVLAPLAEHLSRSGQPFEWVKRSALESVLGTGYYRSALYIPTSVLINPARLTHGLLNSLPKNVTVFENSPVTSYKAGTVVQATTPEGEIVARKCLLTVNGFIGQFGYFPHQTIPLVMFSSLSSTLTPEQIKQMGTTAQWAISPINSMSGATIRYTADHRLFIRHGVAYCPRLRLRASTVKAQRRRHQHILATRFPQLGAIHLEHLWPCWLSMSTDFTTPTWGKVDTNTYCSGVCNDHGIAKQTIIGLLLADHASGVASALNDEIRKRGSPQKALPRPMLDIAIRARLAQLRWQTRAER